MNFADIRKSLDFFGALPVPEQTRARSLPDTRALAGGRITLDKPDDVMGAWRTVLAPQDANDTWRLHTLDASTLDRMSPAQLMELLVDLSPEISRALWDFLRMCNPGWECRALRPGTEDVDTAAQMAIDDFWKLLNGYYGATDVQINRLFMSAFLRGALLGELILDKRGRMPVDLAVIDPYVVSHRRRDDPDRGKVWQLCQRQGSQLVDLDRPTILYIPVDPLPGKPAGRAPANPAVFTAVFGLAMLHDIRRVVQQQGWPRLDIEIDFEKLLTLVPDEDKGNPEQEFAWLSKAVADIKAMYAQLQPDDTYVHLSFTKVNRPVGAVDSSSLGAIDGLFKAIERMAVRALKSVPLLMGLDSASSESQSNRQWEVYAAGIKSLQHLAETMLETLLTLGLQAQGIIATVEFRFAELRVAELLRDAQVEQIQMTNARMAYDNGWISQDEASERGVGKAKADTPEPRAATKGGTVVGGQPDPGSERGLNDYKVIAQGTPHGNGRYD